MQDKILIIDKNHKMQYSFNPIHTNTKDNKIFYVTNHVSVKKRVGRPIDCKSTYKHHKHQYKIKLGDFEKTFATLKEAVKDPFLIEKKINYTTLINISRNILKHKWKHLTIEKINIDI